MIDAFYNGITINGCVFDGSFATTNGTTNCGGFIGWSDRNGPNITNSLMKPSSVAAGMLTSTFARKDNYYGGTVTNSYFVGTANLPTDQGLKARSVTGDENVSVTVSEIMSNTVATYSVSGITAYANGLACDGTYYYGGGDKVGLTITNSAPTPADGYSSIYSASNGKLSGTGERYTLNLSDDDVTISIVTLLIDWQTAYTGEKSDPYLIYNQEQLDLLVQRGTGLTDYKYYKLMNDIVYSHTTDWNDATSTENNFSAISEFLGDFDGNGHTISGIRLYKAGNSKYDEDSNKGLFAKALSKAAFETTNIHDLTLADTRITGYWMVGGIVGDNNGAVIERCNVTSTVAIHSVQADDRYHGGIVGYGSSGSVSHCTSAATLTTADAGQSLCYGAICGYNSMMSISNSLAIGATVPAVKDNEHGAICGKYYNADKLTENYYINCTVAGTENATGVGCQAADVTASNGAVAAYSITEGTTENFVIEFDERYISSGGGITFYNRGFEYDEVLYAPAGETVNLSLYAYREGYAPTYTASADTLSGTGNPYTLAMPAENVSISVSGWTCSGFSGNGTETDPYLISSTDDWNKFSEYVVGGMTFSGKTLKLDADDITVTAENMVGTVDHAFLGTFDGNNKTLIVSIGTSEEPFAERFCGPFRCTYGATIKNLHTTGDIYTADTNAGGVVGRNGTAKTTLQNVTSDVNIHSTFSGAAYHGGLMGYAINAAFENCAFTGKLLGEDSHHIGGLLGMKSYTEGSDASFTNCLFAPAEVKVDQYMSYSFASGGVAYTTIGDDCYYTVTPGTEQGTQVYSSAPADRVYKQVTAADGNQYYMVCTFSNMSADYDYTGQEISVAPTFSAGGTTLTEETDYTIAISPATVKDKGEYTLTVTGKGDYAGSMPLTFTVTGLDGSGTQENPYKIANVDDWNTFVNKTNSGTNYNGKFLQLTADIAVTTMAASNGDAFLGTFDGAGHTLTFNQGTDAEPSADDYCAPFRFTYGATIKNLKTAGTIYTSERHAAGVVGRNGTASATLENVSSSVVINSSYSGNAYHGGLMGYAINATFTGCAFTGSILGTGTHHCGGLLGQKSSAGSDATFTDCLFAPAEVTVGTDGSYALAAAAVALTTFSNCYYTEAQGTAQGTKAYAYATAPTDLSGLVKDYGMVKAYEHGILFDGTYYGIPSTITLANAEDNTDVINTNNGYFADVTLADRTLYKDGAWNTLYLPFNLVLAGSPLAGATARPLTEASISGTTLNLTFGDAVSTLEAGTPYIIKWDKVDGYVDDAEHNITRPVFSGVTIDKTERGYDTDNESVTTDARVRFLGTYVPQSFSEENKSILFLGAENTLYYPLSGASIGACRAYFKIGDDTASARQVTSFSLNFGDEYSTLGVTTPLSPARGAGGEAWYSLDGRRLSQKPSRAGVYINNGVKVVIK